MGMNIPEGLSAAKIEHNIQQRTLKPDATPSQQVHSLH